MIAALQIVFPVIIIVVCYVEVSTAGLNPAVGPHNQVATVGDTVKFGCQQTAAYTLGVFWLFHSLQSTSSCVIYNSTVTDPAALCSDRSRYSVTNSANYFNLTISRVQWSDAGTYGCRDLDQTDTNNGTFSAVFGVIASDFIVTTASNSTCALRGQSVTFACRVYYEGSDLMPLSMNWTTSSGQTVAGSVSNSSGWFNSSLSVPANTSTSLQWNCTVFFQPPTGNTFIFPITVTTTQANNAPSYTGTNSSNNVTVKDCPEHIIVIYNETLFVDGTNITEGENLTCRVTDTSTGTTVLYQWTDVIRHAVVSNESTVTVKLSNVAFSYACSARSSCDQINYPCIINKTVTGYATAIPRTANNTSDCDTPCIISLSVLIPCGVITIVIIIIALCRPCSFCCQCWHSTSDHCCSKCKPGKEKNYQQNASDDSSDMTPEQCHTNPMFNTSNNYPMSSPRNPPDLIHPHPGDSRPYQQNNQGSDPVYADLTENKPGSRKPVAMPSDTVYAPIDKA